MGGISAELRLQEYDSEVFKALNDRKRKSEQVIQNALDHILSLG